MSTVRSPRPLSHWHFGFYNLHAVGAGRLAPLSHDSLVATSCSLINFSSRAFSRWVHMDLAWGPHLESFPLLASSGALGRSGPVSGMCPRPIKAPIDRTMISVHFGLQRDSGLIWGPGPVSVFVAFFEVACFEGRSHREFVRCPTWLPSEGRNSRVFCD